MAEEVEEEVAEGKLLSQVQVDAIVADRLARQSKKFADYDELKAKAAKLDESEAASLSELEKERAARAAAEERVSLLQVESDSAKVTAAITAEATLRGVRNISTVLRAIDRTGLTLGDDGQVSGVEDAVEALLAEIPELVGGKLTTKSADLGARGGGPGLVTQAQLAAMTPEAVHGALSRGELSHLLK